VAYSLKARIVESEEPAVARQLARKQQQKNGVSCAVRADGCVRNNGIRNAIAKQQLHYSRGTVFSVRSVPGLYNELVR
jgi:hypothetical protein